MRELDTELIGGFGGLLVSAYNEIFIMVHRAAEIVNESFTDLQFSISVHI